MIIERISFTGAWRCADIVSGRLVSRVYYGYTKKEALAEFRQHLRTVKE